MNTPAFQGYSFKEQKILLIKFSSIAEKGNHDTLINETGIQRNFVTMRENTTGWNNRTVKT